MADSRRLTIRLQASDDDEGAIRIEVLSTFLQHLTSALRAVESDAFGDPSERKQRPTVYRVVGLSKSSPTTIVLEGQPAEPEFPDFAPGIMPLLPSYIDHINSGKFPDKARYATLHSIHEVVAAFDKNLSVFELSSNGTRAEVTKNTDQNLKRLLSKVTRCRTSCRGYLDALNVHSVNCNATVYPLIGASKIKCLFRKGDIENIGDYVESMVEVFGIALYYPDSDFPHAMELQSIRKIQSRSVLPKAKELVGSFQ